MGLSTFAIGALPTYPAIGLAAPLLLALCRFGQGIGLGGEWGGAILLAVENAPPKKRALYGMFPQLGAPIGFLLSGGTLPPALARAHRQAVLFLRLAIAIPSPAPCWCCSGSTFA
jgi:MFS family permease